MRYLTQKAAWLRAPVSLHLCGYFRLWKGRTITAWDCMADLDLLFKIPRKNNRCVAYIFTARVSVPQLLESNLRFNSVKFKVCLGSVPGLSMAGLSLQSILVTFLAFDLDSFKRSFAFLENVCKTFGCKLHPLFTGSQTCKFHPPIEARFYAFVSLFCLLLEILVHLPVETALNWDRLATLHVILKIPNLLGLILRHGSHQMLPLAWLKGQGSSSYGF